MTSNTVAILATIVTVVLGAGFATLGWLLRQPINGLREDVRDIKHDLDLRLTSLEEWRLRHLENAHVRAVGGNPVAGRGRQ